MRVIKRFLKVIFFAIVIFLVAFIVSAYCWPEKTSEVIGYRFYTVLTNSMEPTISTNSLVLTKVIPKDEIITPNTIITFKANRFGDNILLTHYFRKTQKKDGITYYRTQPEGKDIKDETTYDNYETKRSDIIGTYVCHVPYIGKIILFLQSQFGMVMYAELIIIYLLNKLIKARWKEKEEKKTQEGMEQQPVQVEEKTDVNINDCVSIDQTSIYISDIALEHKGNQCIIHGLLHNESDSVITKVDVDITLFDTYSIMAKQARVTIAREIEVEPHAIHHFGYQCSMNYKISECLMDIKKFDMKMKKN